MVYQHTPSGHVHPLAHKKQNQEVLQVFSSPSLLFTHHASCSAPASANGLSTISHEYLKGSYALDLEAVKQGASSLPHLNKTLVTSCKRLNG